MPITLGGLTLFTLDELSEKLGITTLTLRTYIKEGKIRGRKAGGAWYVSEEALRDFFNNAEETNKDQEDEA